VTDWVDTVADTLAGAAREAIVAGSTVRAGSAIEQQAVVLSGVKG
jgi:hypothetical protein